MCIGIPLRISFIEQIITIFFFVDKLIEKKYLTEGHNITSTRVFILIVFPLTYNKKILQTIPIGYYNMSALEIFIFVTIVFCTAHSKML